MFADFKMWGDTDKVYKGCSFVNTSKIKFPDKITDKMGKICATEVSEKGPRKGSLFTYGICKKPESYIPEEEPLDLTVATPSAPKAPRAPKYTKKNTPGKSAELSMH